MGTSCWYRVFGSRSDGDWYQVRLESPVGEVEVNRWLPKEDDIRAELNTWAAWVEAHAGPEVDWLPGRLATAAQLITWEIDDPAAREWSEALCRRFCQESAGVYQVDGLGFFDADGKLLLAEAP